MSESNPLKDWELEETSEQNDQWQLLDTEQELASTFQLTPDPNAPVQDWQPVEYAEESSGRGGWILPTFIIAAMLAVIGYIVWLGLGGFGTEPTAVTEPTAPANEPAVAVVAETPAAEATATPLPEPTATQPPAPTPEPTQAMVEQLFATINSEYGLNARGAANTDAEVLLLLENSATYPVLEEQGDWLQIELDDGQSGWISRDFATLSTQLVPAPEGLLAQAEPIAAPTDGPAAGEPDDQEPAAGDALRTTGITPPEPFSDIIPTGPAVIVQTEAGVNARSAPSTDGDILLTVPQGAALEADALSDDGEWTRVLLPNGTSGWMFLEALETAGDVAGLGTEASTEASTSAEESTPLTETGTVTDTVEAVAPDDTPAESGTIIATAVIDNLLGLAARSAPAGDAAEIQFLDGGSEWPVTGRTADGLWLRLELDETQEAWVLTGAVLLNVDQADVEVVEP